MKFFRKTGVSTLLNILGMSIAFAVFMILMVQVRWDFSYNKNFEGCERVYRMENSFMGGGAFSTHISRPLIELSKGTSPNIEAVGTLAFRSDFIGSREGDKEAVINIPEAAIDSSMLNIYPFRWLEGSAKGFGAQGAAVISKSYAGLVFGDESPIGKMLEATDGGKYQIIGIFEDTPKNCFLNYGLLVNIGDECLGDSNEWSYSAYVKMKDTSFAADTERAIETCFLGDFEDDGDSEDEDAEFVAKGFRLTNIHDAYFKRDVRASLMGGNRAITTSFLAIAVLLILIALINFINFAFAEVPFRIKSINTRKVLGSSRRSLVSDQIMYAELLAAVAFALAVGIMHIVSGTAVSSYVSDSIKIGDNIGLLAFTYAIAALSAVIAGIAPALYSTAQPAALVLKGSFAMTVKGKMLRNIMVSLQFVLSFIFIIMALYVSVQTHFMMKKDMGFEQDSILQVGCGYFAGRQHAALTSQLLQNPAVRDVCFADGALVSDQKMGWGRPYDGETVFMEVLPVSDNFVDFFGLSVLDGRSFRKSDNFNSSGSFIVNETFMQTFPKLHVGSLLYGHNGEAGIVGIVKDFNFKSLQYAMAPLALYCWGKEPWRNFSMMYVKTVPGSDFKAVSDYIRDAVCSFDPYSEPDRVSVRHLDEWIGNMYRKEQALGRLIAIASLVALLIAIIGILGLVFFETQFLRKEIAVRRVNGASIESILLMINKKYLIMAGISFLISVPVVYYLITAWRKGFAYQAPVPLWIFLLALLLVLAVTFAVVTLQSWRAAGANPVESLKNE